MARRPSTDYLRASLRAAAREAIWAATVRHQPGPRNDIFLFATRRGGSTWAMELISANRGVRPLNQPLETLSRNLTLSQAFGIPRLRQGQIITLNAEEQRQLAAFVNDIQAGRIVVNAPTRFWTRGYDWTSNRLVLKITDAKAAIDWFDQTFPCDIVYLTRHPVPQALSCIRNQWTLTSDAYLTDEAFMAAHAPDTTGSIMDLRRSGDPLAQFVLNWALENAAPAALLADRPHWLHVRYEDCVQDPDGMIERMASHLALDDLEAMGATVTRPSQSSRRSTGQTNTSIEQGAAARGLWSWRDDIDPGDEARCARIVELLGIDLDRIAPAPAR